jgi:hypothetical protein
MGELLSTYPKSWYDIQKWRGSKPEETIPEKTRVVCTSFGALTKTVDDAGSGGERIVVLHMARVMVEDISLGMKR